jgi:hypothetical protein
MMDIVGYKIVVGVDFIGKDYMMFDWGFQDCRWNIEQLLFYLIGKFDTFDLCDRGSVLAIYSCLIIISPQSHATEECFQFDSI